MTDVKILTLEECTDGIPRGTLVTLPGWRPPRRRGLFIPTMPPPTFTTMEFTMEEINHRLEGRK